ncbi:MAG: ABC transporter ATP-binding protein [Actinobacteria bacterium]|nr:ABC transporter ATP-binding protein [Actinomycetota bacterium]
MDTALELENLAKTYKIGWRGIERKAVVDISLAIPTGTVFGLLGPNGAGKTTTIKMAVGFLRPDSGRISIFGQANSLKIRSRIGFLPEQPYFYPHLTAEKALDFYARLFYIKKAVRQERVRLLLDTVGLSDSANLPLQKFSKGMLQRFGIAQALVNNPDLLIVDEPASGLDPIGQVEIRKILTALNAEGKSILLSSHYLSEVENICHEVAIINKGTVISRGKVKNLLDTGDTYAVIASSLPTDWQPIKLATKIERVNGMVRMVVEKHRLDRAIENIRSSGGFIEGVHRTTKTLEQLFMEIIGGDTRGN